jgi:hypothetical protein
VRPSCVCPLLDSPPPPLQVGIYQKQSSFWFQAVTTQTLLHGNVHFNGPRAGINFNDGFGGGDVLERNLLLNCVRESGDHGPFNSWDRVPYITTLRSGKPSVLPAWRHVRRNFFLSNYASQEAIDTDDGSAFFRTSENFFVYAANGLKSDFNGRFNQHTRNVYARLRPQTPDEPIVAHPSAPHTSGRRVGTGTAT